MAPSITTDEGRKFQTRFWDELTEKLEGIQPGVTAGL